MGEGRDGLVTFATVWTVSELRVLIALLRTHRIWATASCEGHSQVEPGLAMALGGIRVRIHEADLPLAVELVDGVDPTPYLGPLFSRRRVVNMFAVLLMIVTCCPAPARIPTHFHFAMRRAEPA